MGKNKYQLGVLVRVKLPPDNINPTALGEITGILKEKDGTSYIVEGVEGHVRESNITAAYRQIRSRAGVKRRASIQKESGHVASPN